MFCTKCGQELSDGTVFCTKCGNKLSEAPVIGISSEAKIVNDKVPTIKPVSKKDTRGVLVSEFDKGILKRFFRAVVIYIIAFAIISVAAIAGGNILNKKEYAKVATTDTTDNSSVKTSLDNLNVGDKVIFGNFEQDGNLRNGAEPLEWDVLDEKNGSYLLITHNVIDSRRFDDGLSDTTIMANDDESASFINWKKCSLRGWLNNYFYATTFNEKERESILISSIKTTDYKDSEGNTRNGESGGVGGGTTSDKVFILSYEEFYNYYFISKSAIGMYCPGGITSPTQYAIDQGAKYWDIGDLYCFTPEYTGYVFEASDSEWNLFKQYISPDHLEGRILTSWILRSPGSYTAGDSLMVVVARGDGVNSDFSVYSEGGIRPAIWVKP